MTERLKAVQRMFWTLLLVAVAVGLLALPRRDDADALAVLDELTSFATQFDRASLERALLARAQAQGAIGLAQVAAAITGPDMPVVDVSTSGAPLLPTAMLTLETLEQIDALTLPGATIELGEARAADLSRSLGWRLSREQEDRFELSSLALSQAGCARKDLEREPAAAAARLATLAAATALTAATAARVQAEELHEQRRKWKATWKAILKANEARLEAVAREQEADKAKRDADGAYEALAAQASKPATAEPPSGCKLATATLTARPSGKVLSLSLPTEVAQRQVPVGQLTGVTFTATRERGLWQALAPLSPARAIENVRARFSWHYRHAEVSGIKLGGTTALQLLPLCLLPCFFGILRRSRGVGASYNPFDRPEKAEDLPMVGLGRAALNAIVLLGLPLAACVLCAWSLIALAQLPVVPVVCAFGCLVLGSRCQLALNELLELREAVTRSHSIPPPAPSITAR